MDINEKYHYGCAHLETQEYYHKISHHGHLIKLFVQKSEYKSLRQESF